VLAPQAPADQCAQYEPDLGCERQIGREADHDAERDAKRGPDGDGSSDAHCPSLRRVRRAADSVCPAWIDGRVSRARRSQAKGWPALLRLREVRHRLLPLAEQSARRCGHVALHAAVAGRPVMVVGLICRAVIGRFGGRVGACVSGPCVCGVHLAGPCRTPGAAGIQPMSGGDRCRQVRSVRTSPKASREAPDGWRAA
jgi:hypothetical protein